MLSLIPSDFLQEKSGMTMIMLLGWRYINIVFQKLENECGNKHKWKTRCSLRETRCFQACLGICTKYLSIRPRLLRYYMVGHSQDRTLWNKTMSIFESSDLLRSTMGTTTPKQHRTLENLFSIQYFFFKGTLYEHCRAFSGPMLL